MAKTKTGDSRKAVYILMESSQTNKYYVGSSMDLSTRFKSYNRKQRGNRIIDNSLNKYGFDSFYKYVVNFEDSIKEADLRLWEGFYIRLFGSYHYENEDGMNLVKNPNTAPSMDENVKKKISNKCKGIKKEWLEDEIKEDLKYTADKLPKIKIYFETHDDQFNDKNNESLIIEGLGEVLGDFNEW